MTHFSNLIEHSVRSSVYSDVKFQSAPHLSDSVWYQGYDQIISPVNRNIRNSVNVYVENIVCQKLV